MLARSEGKGLSLPPDTVMSGRGALRQPWIFAQTKALAAGQAWEKPSIEDTGLHFLDLLARYQPPEFHLSRARRFFNYFCDNVSWGNYLKTRLNKETGLEGIAQAWKSFFQG
jgi:tRNA-dihydrouridine synthase